MSQMNKLSRPIFIALTAHLGIAMAGANGKRAAALPIDEMSPP
jgi:hypothetical protein